MGGGLSNSHNEVFAEHGITSAEDQAKYRSMYQSLQQNGLNEDQIMTEIKKTIKKEKDSKDATSSRTAGRDNVSKRRRSLDKVPVNTACSKVSVRRASKEREQIIVEPDYLPYLCEVCDKGFKSFQFLDLHMRQAEDHAKCIREKEKQNLKTAAAVPLAAANPSGVEDLKEDNSIQSPPVTDVPLSQPKEYLCEYCTLSFSSFILLDRHIRYSDRHTTALREREAKISTDERARRIAEVANKYISHLQTLAQQTKAMEQIHSVAWHRWQKAYRRVKLDNLIKKTEHHLIEAYRVNKSGLEFSEPQLLFRGSKLFWRSQEQYHFHMYLHDNSAAKKLSAGGKGIIEVIGFSSKQVTFDYDIRLYLNYAPVASLVQKGMNVAIDKLKRGAVSTRRKSINTSLPGGSEYCDEKLSESKVASVANDVIGSMIVDRLQLENVTGSVGRMKLTFASLPQREADGGIQALPVSARGERSMATVAAVATAAAREEDGASALPFALDEVAALSVLKPVVVGVIASNSVAKESKVLADQIRSELASITNRAENLVNYVGSSMAKVQDLAVSSVHRVKLSYTTELRKQASGDGSMKSPEPSSSRVKSDSDRGDVVAVPASIEGEAVSSA